nr:bifunctional diaminohydroxyphosphoribosylaminopyrimidine deaminase/5-amino-6-(5-phosphoribosylamino)uracil reductase RibD [Ameyamaea chiangmaiensis]
MTTCVWPDEKSRPVEADGTQAVPLARILAAFDTAIAGARAHVGATAPNPPVGCAILDAEGHCLAVAAHRTAGQPHAEAAALALCAERGLMHRAAIAVVTLEPCNHTGRTPPCTVALLASPVRTVWIGAADPNPHVAGGGAARLASAGCAVHFLHDLGADAARQARDCTALIAPFAKVSCRGEAWITVKQALDATGGMRPPPGARVFTSAAALTHAHVLRRATDAIVTGTGTVLADEPGLDVRHVPDHLARAPRAVWVCTRGDAVPAAWAERMHAQGRDVVLCNDISSLPARLAQSGVLWAMVEGGPRLLASLRKHDAWDDWLTIAVQPDGSESVRAETRVPGVSPLSLFPFDHGGA